VKIALAGTGTRGDIQPLLALASALSGAGHDTWVCGPPDMIGLAGEVGVAYKPFGPIFREFLLEIQATFERRPWAIMTAAPARRALGPQIAELPSLCEGADILVGNPVLPFGPSLGEALGIPYFKAVYQPAVLPSSQYPPPFLHRQDLSPEWNRRFWTVHRVILNTAFLGTLNAGRSRLGLGPIRDVADSITTGSQLIMACDEAIVGDAHAWDFPVHMTGFWHLGSREDALPSEVSSFLEAGSAPVYIGFGSMTAKDPERRTSVVLDAVRRSGVRAVLSAGWAGLGRGLSLPPDCLLVGAVSHAALFPRCAAIVHHGGSGTTAAAALAGRPQVVVPHLLDQYYFSHRVAVAGLGPRPVPVNALSGPRLAAAIDQACHDTAITERAEAVGRKLQARDGLAEAVAFLTKGSLTLSHP
jgi:UDP:flavonoid glycosyltransferase YjiC (YdhE family)